MVFMAAEYIAALGGVPSRAAWRSQSVRAAERTVRLREGVLLPFRLRGQGFHYEQMCAEFRKERVATRREYTILWSPSHTGGTTSCSEGPHSVHCPFCGDDDSKVVDSRDSESGDAIRRRRECLATASAATRPTNASKRRRCVVVKRERRRRTLRAHQAAQRSAARLREAPHPARAPGARRRRDRERAAPRSRCSGHARSRSASARCASCADIDKVAYIRFASVYRQFDDIDEFQQELARLERTGAEPSAAASSRCRASVPCTSDGRRHTHSCGRRRPPINRGA